MGAVHAQNAYIERFNRTASHEWLDLHLFKNIEQAQLLATQWLWIYNNERTHTAIGGIPPKQIFRAAQPLLLTSVINGEIILRHVKGLSNARNIEHIESVDIIIREGNELIPLPWGSQYPGYIFARAKTHQEVISASQKAFSKLNFVIASIIRPE